MPTTDPVTVPIKGKDELTPTLQTAQGGISGFVSSLKTYTQGFQDIRAGMGFVNDGLQLLQKGYNATVGEALNYATTVRQMSRITGQSAEETSRLIQLTDDLGVSQSDLEGAMAASARKGIAFNTESIAKLADQYQRLKDPVARNTLLIDNFGKSGLNMAAAMSKGGDAIREMSGAVSDNLILNQKQLDQARALELQIDDLGDAWQGNAIQIGTAVIPALSDYLVATQSITGETNTFMGILQHLGPVQAITIANAYAQAKANREAAEATDANAKAQDNLATSYGKTLTMAERQAQSGHYGNVYQTHNPGFSTNSSTPQNQTLTVKNEAKLEVSVKVDERGSVLSLQDAIGPAVRKVIRDMVAGGLLKVGQR